MAVIDDSAKTMLQKLPYEKQVDLASCLQSKIEGGTVTNPSGWMMKSCISAGAGNTTAMGGNPMAMGGNMMAMNPMAMGGYSSPNSVPPNPEALEQTMAVIDDSAKTMLQKLPYEKQVDLASCLQSKIESGTVMNPSGWMMKSCIAAGAGNMTAMGGNPMAMGGMAMGGMAMGSMSGGSTTQPNPQAVPLVMMILDDKAKTLLQQLPYEKQVDLASYLQQKMGDGGIRNPSAWMAKSCIAAGASTESGLT